MSREIRVALLAIAAIAVSYWGFNFIIGKNLFKKTNFYYAEYTDVGGLKTSTEVSNNAVKRVIKVRLKHRLYLTLVAKMRSFGVLVVKRLLSRIWRLKAVILLIRYCGFLRLSQRKRMFVGCERT